MTFQDQKLINISNWICIFCLENEKGYVTNETARKSFEKHGHPVRKDATLTRQLYEAAARGYLGKGKIQREVIYFPLTGVKNA